ncbi:hypothetical protein Acr_15g0010830 [Actinidia rufa]|uniref:DUF4378 domain-containing protein n=1 Tax=Actinidia rufa TaxID=165716 RepID=A0A7J0FUU5_9ERIC|nr:hypothetical protein Acr_15g0010830 [Actinidia rufa]
MMAHKHLHELLQEDQEPFLLKNYIADKRSQLNRPNKPIVQKSISKHSIYKKACFFSLQDSPDVWKSPVLNFTATAPGKSPRKSPIKSPNGVPLHIPARTASLLLDAAMRIWRALVAAGQRNRRRLMSTGMRREKIWFLTFAKKRFCSSPLSPFRFALQTSPSPGRRTPVFSSPATSPIRLKNQEEETCETESIQQIHLLEEEEEEKEQFSPVSVLDPPFEDDGDGNNDGDGEDEDGDGYDDIECSYAIVQRAKHQLLQNIRRFEKLAELDPIELEKRMLEEQDENDDLDEEEEREETESRSLCREGNIDGYVREVLNLLGFRLDKLPEDMTRLVLDLISEEKRDRDDIEMVAKRVCERLDSWKEVKSNTIDMMVELNFRGEIDGWKRSDKEQVDKTAVEIEVAILGLLLEELSGEMVYC